MIPAKSDLLRRALVDRIRAGRYPVGGRLPSLRTLAEEFGVHANTVARVVADLAAEGALRAEHGRGTFVLRVPEADTSGGAVEDLYASLRGLAAHARRLGLSRRDWAAFTTEAEAQVFASDGPTMWFVECSPRDAEELAQSLSTLLERSVRPLLVDDLELQVVGGRASEAFFITTPFHLADVERTVAGSAPVVNVQVVATSETLIRFARLDPRARVAIVAANRETLTRFVRMLHSFTRIEPHAALLVDDPAAPAAARDADVVIDSQSIHERVLGWGMRAEVVTIRYQIEPTSLAFLREVLRQRDAGARPTALAADTAAAAAAGPDRGAAG